jgi:hypothetical protein
VAVIAAIAMYLATTRPRTKAPPAVTTGQSSPSAPTRASSGAVEVVVASPPLASEIALPAGWTYYRQPGQFRLAVPIGWIIERDGTMTRFREPETMRRLAVDLRDAPPGGALQATIDRERSWSAGNGAPPGYQLLRLDPVVIGDGGAEWEYNFDDPQAGQLRVISRCFTAGNRYFEVSWTTRTYDTGSRQVYFNLALGGFLAQ